MPPYDQDPADIYPDVHRSASQHMDRIRDSAQALSHAIRDAGKAGISVSIRQSPQLSEASYLLDIIFHF